MDVIARQTAQIAANDVYSMLAKIELKFPEDAPACKIFRTKIAGMIMDNPASFRTEAIPEMESVLRNHPKYHVIF